MLLSCDKKSLLGNCPSLSEVIQYSKVCGHSCRPVLSCCPYNCHVFFPDRVSQGPSLSAVSGCGLYLFPSAGGSRETKVSSVCDSDCSCAQKVLAIQLFLIPIFLIKDPVMMFCV